MAADERMLMCPDNLHEGMKLGPVWYIVMPEQIEAFAHATGAFGPEYTRNSPAGAQMAPLTMRLQDYALLIAKHFRGGSGGVHARHRSEFFAPMRAEQAVRTEGHIEKIWSKRGKFYFELEYESRDAVTEELLVRQAITAVLLHDGRME